MSKAKDFIDAEVKGTIDQDSDLESKIRHVIGDYDFPHINMNNLAHLLALLIEQGKVDK